MTGSQRKSRRASSAWRKSETHGERVGRHGWSNLSYRTRVVAAFALISIMTAGVAFGVLSVVWEQHFQTYTRENVQRVADSTASAIATKYDQSHDWSTNTLSPAASASQISQGLGVQVTNASGGIVYDTTRIATSTSQALLAPSAGSENMATAPIVVANESVGTVKVWVYGSSTLLTQADAEFRDKSYQAMIIATLLAVVLSLATGIFFSRTLVTPINRMTKTAKAIKEGDLTARTYLRGDDEIAHLGEMFDAMADAVEKDRKLERRLTTDVAHELRTPLMAIQSTVEAMVDGVFPADEERLETVNSEVQRLSRLVDALLKLSRLEHRSTPMNRQKVNVGELISGLIATHEAFVHEAGLDLIFETEPDVFVFGDPDMLRQATANLISNAVRYTPAGSVTVRVARGDIMASIMVKDTGVGLTPEEAKMVFSRFWRAQGDRNRETGGLGIGLAVVKEIVDRHGGWVRVEGKPDQGATFTIYIPLFNENRYKNSEKPKERQRRILGSAHNDASKGAHRDADGDEGAARIQEN